MLLQFYVLEPSSPPQHLDPRHPLIIRIQELEVNLIMVFCIAPILILFPYIVVPRYHHISIV